MRGLSKEAKDYLFKTRNPNGGTNHREASLYNAYRGERRPKDCGPESEGPLCGKCCAKIIMNRLKADGKI